MKPPRKPRLAAPRRPRPATARKPRPATSGRPTTPARSLRSSSLPPEVLDDLRATARTGAADAADLLEDAVEALAAERPDEAARIATRAKARAPRSAAVREVLGLAHYLRGGFRDALRELQAFRRMTGRADHNHLLADSHRALGMPERAPELAREALAAPVSPEVKAEAIVVGAAALADLGKFEEALSLLRGFRTDPAESRGHDLRVWYVTGDVLERVGRPREAARQFERILDHDPGAFDTAERLAALRQALGT